MKKRPIRVQFFIWLATLTLVNFLLIGLSLALFDFFEYLEDPKLWAGEMEEVLFLSGVMVVLFPVSLVGAWLISRQLLRPWKALVVQAERISRGQLEDRIEVGNSTDEIGRLAQALNLAFDRYEALLDRVQRFNYDASHQLRNPLAAIRTSGEVCLKHPRSDDEYRSVIGGILEDAGRLNRTVDQLLLLARSARGLEACREWVSLQEIAREVVREGQAVGELNGVSVELMAPVEPLTAEVIPDLLREALANLLDNALKYSPENGRIEVGISPIESGVTRISVSDSGPGLTPEQKARIFRPFTRDPSSGNESVGLGLAIVADVCHAHDARFGVDDNPGGGCRFWIELPAGSVR